MTITGLRSADNSAAFSALQQEASAGCGTRCRTGSLLTSDRPSARSPQRSTPVHRGGGCIDCARNKYQSQKRERISASMKTFYSIGSPSCTLNTGVTKIKKATRSEVEF
ncbi:hypothetical protein J6590_004955, partial [Homalodisca vitripennis]